MEHTKVFRYENIYHMRSLSVSSSSVTFYPKLSRVELLMFCRVITAQVGYIVALGDKDSYMMQVDEILYRRESR